MVLQVPCGLKLPRDAGPLVWGPSTFLAEFEHLKPAAIEAGMDMHGVPKRKYSRTAQGLLESLRDNYYFEASLQGLSCTATSETSHLFALAVAMNPEKGGNPDEAGHALLQTEVFAGGPKNGTSGHTDAAKGGNIAFDFETEERPV